MAARGEILVVEDSRLQAKRLRDFLQQNGYQVRMAFNGQEGLEATRSHRPALIISDIIMPVMDGFEMCRTIKDDVTIKRIPIILLTSLSNPDDILAGLAAGADSYVSKPYDGKILLSRIRTVLATPAWTENSGVSKRLQIRARGKRYVISSNPQQVLSLLLSTYEDAVLQNLRLRDMRRKLVLLNERLEKIVAKRTQALRQEISQRKRAQAALARQARDLARSNADLQQFAYVASHDLQEPLRMVASYTQLLSKRYKGKLDQDADEFIGYAVDGVVRMQALIKALLEYSRVGTRGKELVRTDCGKVMEETLANLQGAIEETGALITTTVLPTVRGDATQLGQLFQNLVGNAIKFCKDGTPCIHVSAERKSGAWEFAVKDNGIGIDSENLDRIFEIFQRLHTPAEYPGTGIGLALCKKIVERHGGTMWVESEPDSGSTFFFTIPAAEARAEKSHDRQTSSNPAG